MSRVFAYGAGVVVGTIFLFSGKLIVAPKSHEKAMGLILFLAGTLPLISTPLDDLAFAAGCLTPAAFVGWLIALFALGHSPAAAIEEGKATFFFCALPCLPLLVARLFRSE